MCMCQLATERDTIGEDVFRAQQLDHGIGRRSWHRCAFDFLLPRKWLHMCDSSHLLPDIGIIRRHVDCGRMLGENGNRGRP